MTELYSNMRALSLGFLGYTFIDTGTAMGFTMCGQQMWAASPITTPGFGPSRSWKGSEAMGGCWRPLHRWLQVQCYAWLITKGLQRSDERSGPFLSRARRQKAQSSERRQQQTRTGVVKRVNRHGNEQLQPFPFPLLAFCGIFALIFVITCIHSLLLVFIVNLI